MLLIEIHLNSRINGVNSSHVIELWQTSIGLVETLRGVHLDFF